MAESDTEDKDSKTEEATPYKREELKKKGRVAHSRELGNAAVLLIASIFLYFYGRTFFEQLIVMFRKILGKIENFELTDANLVSMFMEMTKDSFIIIAPILMICVIIGLLSSVSQTGFIFSSETLKFNLEKINPVSGFKRLFSMRSSIEALKAMIKLTIIASIVYFVIKNEIAGSVLLADNSIEDIVSFIAMAIFKTTAYVAGMMLIFGIADVIYQKLIFERDIKMTKHEVREELKEREGDPNVRARVRSIQRKMATKRMIQKVPKAQVVITNPTHLAIALQYNKDMKAPRVIAKGADYLAEKIRKIAKEHDIPLVENKPLAQTLYKTVKVGGFIPENLYNAVAEVLAYVMKLKTGYSDTFMGDNLKEKEENMSEVKV